MRWIYNRERTWIYNSQKKSWRESFCQDFHLLDGRGGGWVVISTFLHSSSSSLLSSLLSLQSKHLKGQLGPRVGHVTFLDQRRSVGAPCWSPDARSKTLRTPQNCILARRTSLGLAGRAPAYANHAEVWWASKYSSNQRLTNVLQGLARHLTVVIIIAIMIASSFQRCEGCGFALLPLHE